MRLFLSTFKNKIDKKGRVSIPALFRNAIVAKSPMNTFVAFPSISDDGCIECCDYTYFERIVEGLEDFGPYTDEYRAFANAILAASHPINFDNDGRVILPQELVDHAGLEGEVCFVGLGKTFQIWNPGKYEPYLQGTRNMALEQRDKFRLPKLQQEVAE